MKKIFYLFVAFILLTSYQSKKVDLGLNLTKGEIYYQTMNSNMTITQTINGTLVNVIMGINGKMSYKVTDVQDSGYNMEVRYENLSMKIGMANTVKEFSSEKNDETDIISELLGILKNKPFFVKMSRTGKVSEVRNIETIFAQLFDKFPQLTAAQKQQIQDQLMQAYGEKAFKGNLEMISAIFPDSPVSKGDKWPVNIQLESGMACKLETVYELTDIGRTYYQLSGNTIMESADKDAYIETNGMPLKYDLQGTMLSDIKINKKTGWIMNATITQAIKGTAYIKDNPKMPGGMTIPITMNSEMSISE